MSLSKNCDFCGNEFDILELRPVAISRLQVTKFHICEKCINSCDPKNDYEEIKKIIEAYSSSKK